MADLQRTPLGDLMARIVGDVEVLGVGVREFTIEIWDTVLFSLSFVVAMLVIDPGLTLLALSPAPLAMILAHATGRWVARRTTRAREASADLTSAIQEHLAGIQRAAPLRPGHRVSRARSPSCRDGSPSAT